MVYKNLSYRDLTFLSFNKLKENPVLFVPDIILYLVLNFLTFFFYKFGGVSDLAQLLQPSLVTEKFQLEIFAQFFQTNWVQIVTSAATFFIITFFVGVGVLTVKFNMLKDLIKGEGVSFWRAWKEKSKLFWHVVFLRILIYVITFVVLVVVVGLALLTYYTTSKFIAITLGSIIGVLALLFLILLKLGLLFRYPILFLKEGNALRAFKESFVYFKKKPAHIFFVWLTILIVGILFGVAGLLFSNLNALSATTTFVSITTLLVSFIAFVLNLVYTVWSDVFLFHNY